MMVRWVLILMFATGALAVSVGSGMAITRSSKALNEQVRVLRIEHQQLEQQLQLLQFSAQQKTLGALDHELSDIQIGLVELMTRESNRSDAIFLSFEQSVLPEQLGAGTGVPVSVLRFELSMKIKHADALLGLVDRLDQHMVVWPYEVRACSILRHDPEGLSARCVVDFYHWSEDERVSLRIAIPKNKSGRA